MVALGVLYENIYLVEDSTLGSEIPIPARVQSLLSGMTKAFESSKGFFAGNVIEFENGFKANLIEMIGAMRLLSTYQEQLRKAHVGLKKNTSVSYQELSEAVYRELGVNTSSATTYALRFTKGLIQTMCRPISAGHFPGGITHALKERCGASTLEHVAHKMGYTPVVASGHKVLKVMTTLTMGHGAKMCKLHPLANNEMSDFKTFRSAVALLLPKINPQSDIPMMDQIKVAPLKKHTLQTLRAYKENRMPPVVDALNVAFAVVQTIGSKTSKSSPELYRQARGHLVNMTHEMKLVDALGNEYNDFKEIPQSVRGFLRKAFQFPELKREREEGEPERSAKKPRTRGPKAEKAPAPEKDASAPAEDPNESEPKGSDVEMSSGESESPHPSENETRSKKTSSTGFAARQKKAGDVSTVSDVAGATATSVSETPAATRTRRKAQQVAAKSWDGEKGSSAGY
jgi:hypothetical protein